MPDYVTSDPFLSQLAGGLAGVATGLEQGRQQRFQENLQQQQAQRDAQYSALQNQLAQQQIAAGQSAAEQAASQRKFEAGLKLPPNWTKLDDNAKIAYLQQRLSAATAAGDQNVVNSTQALINSIATGTYKEAQAAYTAGAKTDLTEAQTEKIRSWREALNMQLANKLQVVGAQERGRIQAAMKRGVSGAGALTFDQRRALELQKGLFMLAGHSEADADRMAYLQYQYQLGSAPAGTTVAPPGVPSSGLQIIPMTVPGTNTVIYAPAPQQANAANPAANVTPAAGGAGAGAGQQTPWWAQAASGIGNVLKNLATGQGPNIGTPLPPGAKEYMAPGNRRVYTINGKDYFDSQTHQPIKTTK